MFKKFRFAAVLCLSLIMVLSTAVPVFALTGLQKSDDTVVSTSVTFTKNVFLDENANVPNIGFEFKVSGNDTNGEDTNFANFNGINFMNGLRVGGSFVFVTPPPVPVYSITEITDWQYVGSDGKIRLAFTSEDEAQTGEPASDGQKYVSKSFVLDFANVVYNNPGVYRYTVTEVNSAVGGVHYDDEIYYVDVYVQWQPTYDDSGVENGYTDQLVIGGIIITDSEGNKITEPEFNNSIDTFDLTVDKTVTGNQGSHTQDFTFTVEISNVPEGSTYVVTYSNAAGDRDVVTEAASEEGTITFETTLKHLESFTIENLPYGATYTITETSEEGYTTTYSVDSADAVTGNEYEFTDGMTADMDVAYINNRQGTIPTGVLLTIAPFAVLVVVGAIGFVLFSRKKKANSNVD